MYIDCGTANSIDESTMNQIASKLGAQSKILRLLDELATHCQTSWGPRGHPQKLRPALCLALFAWGASASAWYLGVRAKI